MGAWTGVLCFFVELSRECILIYPLPVEFAIIQSMAIPSSVARWEFLREEIVASRRNILSTSRRVRDKQGETIPVSV